MNESTRTSRRFIAPVILAGLAVMAPLALAGEASASLSSRDTIVARSTERTDSLVELVSRAARQFCGQHTAVMAGAPVTLEDDLLPVGVVVSPRPAACTPLVRLSPRLLDLPPPLL